MSRGDSTTEGTDASRGCHPRRMLRLYGRGWSYNYVSLKSGLEVLGLYRKRPLRGSVNHIGVGGRFRYSDLKEAAGYGI